MAETIITPQEHGPYHVKGDFRLILSDGTELDVEGGETWLCRCGLSSMKPFCDCTHNIAESHCDNAEMVERSGA